LAAPATASPLPRLAQAFADEVARVARGRAVELAPIQDRTGLGGTLALDLHRLILARLEGRVRLESADERLVVTPALSENGKRLVLSARVTGEPGARLLDVLSASAEYDGDLLTLSPTRPVSSRTTVDIVSTTRTPSLDGPVLDLAFAGDDRLVLLFPDSVALHRVETAGLAQESRRRLPGPLATVRAAAGMLVASEREASLWAMTNRSPRAVLLELDGSRLVERAQAEALPWPGSPAGLRYRAGTNLLDGALPTLGAGPFLAVRSVDGDAAVLLDGQLRLAGAPGGPRVGPALARLGRGLLAAPSADPPGDEDSLLVLARDDSGVRLAEALPVEGAVRALAARTKDEATHLVLAVERSGATHLLFLDLRRRDR
jgi:hypothetical protein